MGMGSSLPCIIICTTQTSNSGPGPGSQARPFCDPHGGCNGAQGVLHQMLRPRGARCSRFFAAKPPCGRCQRPLSCAPQGVGERSRRSGYRPERSCARLSEIGLRICESVTESARSHRCHRGVCMGRLRLPVCVGGMPRSARGQVAPHTSTHERRAQAPVM
jgi:hypothetical protein